MSITPVRCPIEILLGQDPYSAHYFLRSGPEILSTAPSAGATIVTLDLRGDPNPYAIDSVVTIKWAQQPALIGPWTVSAATATTITIPVATPGQGGRGGRVTQPIDLTGAELYSEIRATDDPESPLLATLTLTPDDDPTTGGFTELLAGADMGKLDPQAEGYWHDAFARWPGGDVDKIKYGPVFVKGNATAVPAP